MTTIHANRARDALSRVETLVMMSGVELPSRPIRQQIASAFHIIVHLSRETDGGRRIVQISEITGMEEDTITMQEIFRFRPVGPAADGKVRGVFEPTGLRPRILDRLAASGGGLPPSLQALFPLYR